MRAIDIPQTKPFPQTNQHISAATGKDAVLAEATQAWNDSPTEENWQRLHALIEQLHAMSILPDRF